MGFEVPIGGWLRGPLRAWASDILDPRALDAGGVFRARPVTGMLRDHVRGRADHAHLLWTILMFEDWRRQWNAVL